MHRLCLHSITSMVACSLCALGHAQHDHNHELETPVSIEHPANEFNPAFGAVIDLAAGYENEPTSGQDGYDLRLRTFELSINAEVYRDAWAYASLVADDDQIVLEEAAVHYLGLGGSVNLLAGRFFVDFGQQMQSHIHDLSTLERPLALRAYLGEELAGTGLQLERSWTVGKDTRLWTTFGVFDSLLAEHAHGEEESEGPEPELATADRGGLGDLGMTARLALMGELGQSSNWQAGLSWRGLPNFSASYEPSGASISDLSNHVFGLDALWSQHVGAGQYGWSLGGELLLAQGDLSPQVSDAGSPMVPTDDTLSSFRGQARGFYSYADLDLNESNRIGVLFSAIEHPEPGLPRETEWQLQYTYHLSDSSRLRCAMVDSNSDESGHSNAVVIQFTNFFGAHAHGGHD